MNQQIKKIKIKIKENEKKKKKRRSTDLVENLSIVRIKLSFLSPTFKGISSGVKGC
jgi:hypothetical protein